MQSHARSAASQSEDNAHALLNGSTSWRLLPVRAYESEFFVITGARFAGPERASSPFEG
jgi:hypothetical protein